MSDSRWRLDGVMFTLAVEAFGRDRLPYPFRYRPEPTGFDATVSYDDCERMRAEARQRVARGANERLFNALSVLLEPQIRIEVHGFHGPDFTDVVRVHAGMTETSATLAIQQPGPTQRSGRDVILAEVSPRSLPGNLTAQLPKCTAGKYESLRTHASDVHRPIYNRHPNRLSLTEQIGRITRRPRSGFGEVGVYAAGAVASHLHKLIDATRRSAYIPGSG